MKNPILRTAVAAVTAGLISGTALAGNVITEGDEDIIIKTKGGFEAKTASEDFSFKLGGRVQVQYDAYQDAMNLVDGDGSTGSDLFFRRARIYLKGTMYKDWAYKLQFNVVDSGSGGGVVEDLYIRWQRFNWANITVGKHKEPFSLQELTSSKWVSTVERATINDFLAEGRSLGISVHGANNFWGYALGLYDNRRFDENGKQLWATTGRVHLSPINSERALLHLGIGASLRDVDEDIEDDLLGGTAEASQGIKRGDEVLLAVDPAKGRTLLNVEAAGKIGPFHGQVEWHQRDTKAADVAGALIEGEDATASGYYVQAGWFITGEARPYKKGKWDKPKPRNKGLGAWELVARYEALDFSDDSIIAATQNKGTIGTLGVNWYANEIVRVSANYVQSSWDEPLAAFDGDLVRADSVALPVTAEDTGRGVSIRFQAAF